MTQEPHDAERGPHPCTSLSYEEITSLEIDPATFERIFERALAEYIQIQRDDHNIGTFEDFCCWIANTAAEYRDYPQ